ncbi:hypothetical protein B0H11DRAFT_2225376 [Mycena galericulata]|nr:hypothetical protein B0H11DRAFT_2225376 [Mycena galericulata]
MTKAGCMFPRASSPYFLLVMMHPVQFPWPCIAAVSGLLITDPLLRKTLYVGYVPDLSQSPAALVSFGSTAMMHIRSGSLPLSRTAAPFPAPARMHAPQPGVAAQAAMPTLPGAIRHIHLALDHRIRNLIAASHAKKENKVSEFMDDPTRTTPSRPQPRQRRFFVNYPLCNYVLPDRTSECHVRSALQTIDVAAKELPLASKILKILPDDFSHICQVIRRGPSPECTGHCRHRPQLELYHRYASSYAPPALHKTTFNSLFRRDLDIRCNLNSNKLTAPVYFHLVQRVGELVVLQAGYDHSEAGDGVILYLVMALKLKWFTLRPGLHPILEYGEETWSVHREEITPKPRHPLLRGLHPSLCLLGRVHQPALDILAKLDVRSPKALDIRISYQHGFRGPLSSPDFVRTFISSSQGARLMGMIIECFYPVVQWMIQREAV